MDRQGSQHTPGSCPQVEEQNRELSIFAKTRFWIARRFGEEKEGVGLGSVYASHMGLVGCEEVGGTIWVEQLTLVLRCLGG